MLVDIGVNLCDKSFAHDLNEVIARAHDVGVATMVLTGTSESVSQSSFELAQRHEGLFSTAGVHPHYASSCDDKTLEHLRELLTHERVVAVGECGLDYNRDRSPRDVQRKWFEAQLELSQACGKPLFLHERDAADDMIALLTKHRAHFEKGVVHCFTGDEKTLDAYLDLDMHIGITGWICDERRGKHLLDLVKKIPRDRLMVETDAPYLTPRTIRPRPKTRRNEPCNLPYVVETLAEALGQSEEAVALQSTQVARAFFSM